LVPPPYSCVASLPVSLFTSITFVLSAQTFEVHFIVQVAMWYFFSTMYNIEIKKIFLHYDLPWTASMLSFAVACVGCTALMSREKERRTSENDSEDVHARSSEVPYRKLLAIGLLQFLGNFATNLSIQAMSVSFTHVVKATEVIFVVIWSIVLTRYGLISRVASVTGAQIAVILIITIGVMIASMHEATFSWHGLVFGMLANIGFSGRNILSKWVMSNHDITKERLFVIASFISCAPCILPVLMFELPALSSLPRSVFLSLFYTSVMFFLYNTISFTVLEGVSPVTHAIANCCKRLFIVVVSIIVFKTAVAPLNIIGSLVAIFGIALYSQLGTGQSLGAVIKKNLLFILFGSLIVTGVLLMPRDLSPASDVSSDSESLQCPPIPTLEPKIVFPPAPIVNYKFNPERPGNSELIKYLQSEIIRRLAPSFAGYKKVVVLDVPDHNNKGDSAIYTGEDAFLRLLNIEMIYACSDGGKFWCDTKKIIEIANPKDTLITLHGGGNFGDLWQWVVDLRNRYVQELIDSGKGYEFLMFPQTVTFRNKENIKKVQAIYGKIKKMTFTVRDIPSQEFMEEYFPNITTIYMPDMAWLNGHKEIVKTPKYQILFFLRTDHEGEKLGGRVDKKMKEDSPGVTYKIADWTQFDVEIGSNPLVELNFDRFYSGLDFLQQGKVVVTNRLHGHILSTLLDLPHVIVDNIYGKVFDNHNAWTLNATGVEMAEDIEEAIEKAIILLSEMEKSEYDKK
jgi:exopolysaccharide biosynthesis predicted pyruvyltransferase EpsI/drug/metabolite transporter (DMT)-like permease